jgi:hypothetical protein
MAGVAHHQGSAKVKAELGSSLSSGSLSWALTSSQS